MPEKPAQASEKPSGKAGVALRVAAILAAALGVFWLPWHVGSAQPVVGESYVLGFNNHAGILALAVAMLLAAAGCYFGPRAPAACRWLCKEPRFLPPWREARAEYSILIAVCLVMATADLWWSNYLVDAAWCDARGLIFATDLVAVGQVPYRDFMYNYGPGTIYPQLWLSDLTGGRLSFEQAYSIVLVLYSTLGFAALFALLRSLEIPASQRALILGLASISWMAITLAVQYTPLRYCIVPISIVLLDAAARRGPGMGIAPLAWTGLAALAAAAACLAISPELGVAGVVAILAYGFMLALRRWFPGAAVCWLGAGLAFGAFLLAFPGYLDSVFAFGAGGSNFPIYPNAHNLCMVAISLMVIPPLVASALANPGEVRAPLALGLAVGGGMLLPGAFGRCDPGHVTSYGLTPSLIMFAAAASAGRAASRAWISVYALLFAALSQLSYWNTYTVNFKSGFQMRQFYDAHPDTVAAWKGEWEALLRSSPHGGALHWSKVLLFPAELRQLTTRGRVLLTSGNEGNLWLARYLLLQNPAPREYYNAYSQGAATPAQIERKVREDQAYRFLMVPESVLAGAGGRVDLAAYRQWMATFLSKLLLFPIDADIKNTPYLPDSEYAQRILASYKPIGRYYSYVILDKGAAPAQ